MNRSKCPNCRQKLGDFLYAGACPRCHKLLPQNQAEAAKPEKMARTPSWAARTFSHIVRFVES